MKRRGYSLLELLIALALLGALMSLAWSMLGSYRQAEQRGWDQSYRMQVVRAARELLESDADHWAATAIPADEIELSAVSSLSKGFRGSGTEITIEMLPSIDPLPWLEQITAVDPNSPVAPGGPSPLPSADAESGRDTVPVHGPLNRGKLRYSLTPVAETESGSPVFHLRRELSMIASPQRGARDDSSPRDELTAADLYRLTDDTPDEDGIANAATTATTVRHLIDARFRFSDGQRWLTSWDEASMGGLPRAIELSFDLPRPGETFAADRQEISAGDGEPDGSSTFEVGAEAGADVAASEEALQRDVRIVVRVAAGDAVLPISRSAEVAP